MVSNEQLAMIDNGSSPNMFNELMSKEFTSEKEFQLPTDQSQSNPLAQQQQRLRQQRLEEQRRRQHKEQEEKRRQQEQQQEQLRQKVRSKKKSSTNFGIDGYARMALPDNNETKSSKVVTNNWRSSSLKPLSSSLLPSPEPTESTSSFTFISSVSSEKKVTSSSNSKKKRSQSHAKDKPDVSQSSNTSAFDFMANSTPTSMPPQSNQQ